MSTQTDTFAQEEKTVSNVTQVSSVIIDLFLLIFSSGVDSCNGDSGGPLFLRDNDVYTLRGIVSFGSRRCGTGSPGVYTNVREYIPWIQRNMRS